MADAHSRLIPCSGGSGPVVVLLHGYAETSDSCGPLAADLVKNYTVVVPELRGTGRSSRQCTCVRCRSRPTHARRPYGERPQLSPQGRSRGTPARLAAGLD